jgi:hypothetical protein
MRWVVELTYDGTVDPDHGPVTQLADDRVDIGSVLSCGTYPDGYTVVCLIADGDTEDDALQGAALVADQWAEEVGIPTDERSVKMSITS